MNNSVFFDVLEVIPRGPRGMCRAIDTNWIPFANVVGMGVPGAGPSLGARATNALGTATPGGGVGPGTGNQGYVPTGGFMGQPLMWWLVFAGGVGLIWWIAERGGERADFSNIKISFLSVLLLSLVPLVGIPVWKTVVTALPFPQAAKTFVQAA
jgi:hypothetical protein